MFRIKVEVNEESREGAFLSANVDADANGEEMDPSRDALDFSVGNQRVEHITGVIHLYKRTDSEEACLCSHVFSRLLCRRCREQKLFRVKSVFSLCQLMSVFRNSVDFADRISNPFEKCASFGGRTRGSRLLWSGCNFMTKCWPAVLWKNTMAVRSVLSKRKLCGSCSTLTDSSIQEIQVHHQARRNSQHVPSVLRGSTRASVGLLSRLAFPLSTLTHELVTVGL